MRPDFAVLILTNNRPDRIYTLETLKKSGYTGKVYLVIDNEDESAGEYRRRYGSAVVEFDKAAVAEYTDDGDNFGRRGVLYARNACFEIARRVGVKYFMELDDDYTSFFLRFDSSLSYGNTPALRSSLDDILEAMIAFFDKAPVATLAMSQGGDHIGGISNGKSGPRMRRKAMNAFLCSVDRPFKFIGRMNDDVNTYVTLGRRGDLFLTVLQIQLVQMQTQTNAGGLTELYLDFGTYVKSFYSVMYAPSCVQIGVMGDPRGGRYRIHHKIDWPRTAPCILREEHKRAALP